MKEMRLEIKKNDIVVISNPDSSFYNKKGRVLGISPGKVVSFYQVYIFERKQVYTFIEYDMKKEEWAWIRYWKERFIDSKWRIYIPKKIREEFKDSVFLTIGEEDTVIILNQSDSEKYSFNFEVNISSQGRITIPDFFRDSISFFYGKKVDLVEFEDRLEIWPCPHK